MNELYDNTPVALYARVSSDRQDVDLSVAAQLRALREHAARNGYTVVREFVDEAESGRVADRPQFRKMIDEASKSQAPFREILVWKFSRFTRKREHAVAFKSMLRRKGIRVVSITEHADDTPTGKLMEAIIESVDEFYSENLATEVLRGMREAASRGFWVSSHAPFGYNRVMVQDGPKKRPTLEVNPDSSRIVKRIFDLAEAAKGTQEITRILNGEGIASPRGKLWGKTTVHGVLTNEAYTGTLVWGEGAKDKGEPVRVEKAFPAIVTKTQFRKVNRQMRSRAPKVRNPRRVGSSYLLSGLAKCQACDSPLTGRFAKSGQYAYYVCPTSIKVGRDACPTPTLNARRFEELVVNRIRSNILTEDSIRDLVKVVESEMGGVTREQRKRLETIDSELNDVRQRLGRLYNLVETTDMEVDDFRPRIRELRERQDRLECSAEEARTNLAQRRKVLEDVNAVAAYAREMKDFLEESELTERRAFIETFVKEILVVPGDALMRYTVPMPSDSLAPGKATDKVALPDAVLSTVQVGGPGHTDNGRNGLTGFDHHEVAGGGGQVQARVSESVRPGEEIPRRRQRGQLAARPAGVVGVNGGGERRRAEECPAEVNLHAGQGVAGGVAASCEPLRNVFVGQIILIGAVRRRVEVGDQGLRLGGGPIRRAHRQQDDQETQDGQNQPGQDETGRKQRGHGIASLLWVLTIGIDAPDANNAPDGATDGIGIDE